MFVWRSNVHGYGLFARKNMTPGDIICLYSGSRRKADQVTGDFVCDIHGDPSQKIDGRDLDNYSGRWINHSITPNARLCNPLDNRLLRCHKRRVAIIVECVKPIIRCEEIFIDYGKHYFTREDGTLDMNYFYSTGMKFSTKDKQLLLFSW